jgi:hypothetical protein
MVLRELLGNKRLQFSEATGLNPGYERDVENEPPGAVPGG